MDPDLPNTRNSLARGEDELTAMGAVPMASG
jgi:hypothetical protein